MASAFEAFKVEWKQNHSTEGYTMSVEAIKALINVIRLSEGISLCRVSLLFR